MILTIIFQICVCLGFYYVAYLIAKKIMELLKRLK